MTSNMSPKNADAPGSAIYRPAIHLRSALASAWPALCLAALLLLPFVNTPFTIDDPIYLREAQHLLTDPLHPQAFNVVWSTDFNLRASEILPGGVAFPYLLLPTVLAGAAEWVGHLTQLLFLLIAIVATAQLALRLGLNARQARWSTILTATCPAVLPMAATVMPDIAAMLFSILGMERIVAWRDGRKWHQAGLATCWLTLAVLTRSHTAMILAPAAIFLLDGITRQEIRSSFRSFPARFLPVILVPIAFLIATFVTADPESTDQNVLVALVSMPGGVSLLAKNIFAFLAHWVLVVPLTVPWLSLRFAQVRTAILLIALFGGGLLSVRAGWIAFPVAATILVLGDILLDALKRRDRVQLALWLWLLIAFPVVLYIQLPSKYLLPSAPAAAIMIVRLHGRLLETRRESTSWLIPSFAAWGTVLSLLILLGVRDLANIQRRAVEDLVVPHILAGDRVWFTGNWGFQWYAEAVHSTPATVPPPWPQPGDIVIVSWIDLSHFAVEWTGAREVLQSVSYTNAPPGRIMDLAAGAGFFSNGFGYLPWAWGRGDASRFEVWRVE